MKYDLEKKDGGIFEATIKLTKEEWEESINSAYEKNKGKYNVQGFRKGHVPRNVIEKTYGAGVFMQDALDDVFYKGYTLVLREHEEIKPIDLNAILKAAIIARGKEFASKHAVLIEKLS